MIELPLRPRIAFLTRFQLLFCKLHKTGKGLRQVCACRRPLGVFLLRFGYQIVSLVTPYLYPRCRAAAPCTTKLVLERVGRRSGAVGLIENAVVTLQGS